MFSDGLRLHCEGQGTTATTVGSWDEPLPRAIHETCPHRKVDLAVLFPKGCTHHEVSGSRALPACAVRVTGGDSCCCRGKSLL